ncbi:hypothetical protein BU23DRAFT_458969 [Bimuria novae-zelandiae CBS 107.79]|uniref:endo-1,3(4)-beta-glucanase n=1 Tax=Bimuria novae-zelandiae CBS 107.79 TaxID=1447943 RepID=A0A6A5VDR8_9PLEO|nr:hypothetical protein BU23DRAFT_458969 [Bimuria novae-zelandiae CBS 107.79]
MHFSTIISTVAFAAPALAGYVLQEDYMTDFYGHFNFFNQADPTHGFVKYVDEATARDAGLIDATGVKWGVDTVNKDEGGRASIRLESKTVYNKGLVVIDVKHMPFGCGTWPAFWMFGPNWPYQGEIDILEGVHEEEYNAFTLHTSTGCTVGQDTSSFSGSVATQSCDVKAEGQSENAGCSIKSPDTKSYGAGFNDNGGGVYATEWTSDAISIWFFPRGAIPDGVTGDSPDPSTWGTPSAKWASDSCDVDGIFKDLNIIFDTTFCGDWAGNTWSTSTCASKAPTCNEYVRDNPEAFQNAFWSVDALKVYQQGDAPAQEPPVEGSPSTVPEQPVSTQVPVEQPTTSVNASISSAPAEQVPTATAETDPAVAAPVSTPARNGGFNWPGAPQGTGLPSVAPPVPSFDAGNSTGYPTLPTGTGVPIDWNTVPSFPTTIPIVTVSGQGPAPSPAQAEEGGEPSATVKEPISQTVVVTVDAGALGLPTQAPEAPIARMARREREVRRRMVQHNRP